MRMYSKNHTVNVLWQVRATVQTYIMLWFIHLHALLFMVLYGIKVENSILSFVTLFFDSINTGESNTARPDNYTCLFSKMIQHWRRTWNERTKGITDIQFPFGFVQVSFTYNHENKFIYKLLFKTDWYIHSYQQIGTTPKESMVFHRFAGNKHLMLAMFQITSFRKFLWLSLWTYVMILMGPL